MTDDNLVRADATLATLANDVKRVVLLLHDVVGIVRGHFALVAGYDETRGLRLVVAVNPGRVIADTNAVVLGDGGGTLFYVSGRAVGARDSDLLRDEWQPPWNASHPARWNDPSLLAITVAPGCAEAWSRGAAGGLAWTRAAIDTLQRRQSTFGSTLAALTPTWRRRREPIEGLTTEPPSVLAQPRSRRTRSRRAPAKVTSGPGSAT